MRENTSAGCTDRATIESPPLHKFTTWIGSIEPQNPPFFAELFNRYNRRPVTGLCEAGFSALYDQTPKGSGFFKQRGNMGGKQVPKRLPKQQRLRLPTPLLKTRRRLVELREVDPAALFVFHDF